MSTSNRSEIERKRDRAQRERASMAKIANEENRRNSGLGSLFPPPSRESNAEERDQTTKLIESLFGRWDDVKWVSGNPVRKKEQSSEKSPAVPPSTGSGITSQLAKEHRQLSQSSSTAHQDSRKDRYNRNTVSNHHRSDTDYKHDSNRSNSHDPSRSSYSKSGLSSHSRSNRQGSSSSQPKSSPVHPPYSGSVHPKRNISPESEPPSHLKEFTTKPANDHQDSCFSSDRKSRYDGRPTRGPSTPPSSPPPNQSPQPTPSPDQSPTPSNHTPHRTPPPFHRTTPYSQRTPPPVVSSLPRSPAPVHHTPPVARHAPSPVNACVSQRSPLPSSLSPLPRSGTKGQGDTKPSLFLNINRENKTGELDDIFKEMAVTTPLTALSETPVKCKKAPLFKFASNESKSLAEPIKLEVDGDITDLRPALSPLPDTDEYPKAKEVKEESAPPAPVVSSISADLEVSDDSDADDAEMEEKTEEDDKDKSPNSTPVKKEAGHSSSEESSSSDDSSVSDSESSSSDSGDENEEDDDAKEDASLSQKDNPKSNNIASTPPDKKTNGGWCLSQFITKSSPASVVTNAPVTTEASASKGESSHDTPMVKSSPRKISEIGPCNTMPFIVHDDSDPIPRDGEKASVSPDTISTPSSHTSSQDMSKGSKNNARRDSDPTTNNKLTPVSRPEVTKMCYKQKSVSEDKGQGSSDNVGKVSDNGVDATKSSYVHQQRKRRRTNSGEGTKKPFKSSPATSASSEVDSVHTTPPDVKSVSGKSWSCDAAQQKVVDATSESVTSASSSKKPSISSKAKTPNRRSSQSVKSITKKTSLSSNENEDSGKSSSSKSVNSTMTDIGNIIKDISVPQLLSPTFPGEVCKTEPVTDSLHIPTLTCGKPSIVVRLKPCFVCRSPQRRVKGGRAHTKQDSSSTECGTGKLASSVECKESDSKQGDNKQSSVKGASGKFGFGGGKKRDSESVSGTSSLLSTPPAKRKKKEDDSSLKKEASSHISKPSPEINGVAHPDELKKAGSKRVIERRNSASSSGSRSSQKSTPRELATGKKSVPKKVKKSEADSQPDEKVTSNSEGNNVVTKDELPFNSYKEPEPSPKPTPVPTPPPSSQSFDLDSDHFLTMATQRLETQEFYMQKAKELKHIADKKHDKPSKLMPYIRSVLYFIMSGHAYEKQSANLVEPQRAYSIFMETLSLHNYVNRLRMSVLHDLTPSDRERKLSVLILRIQAILYLKLFTFRRSEVMKLKKIIDTDPNKPNSSMKLPGHAPSPSQNHWNKNSTGTPSPMSPTPSPACSIGSVESQGSCEHPGGKMTNGNINNGSMSSPATVAVPIRIHSVTQKYVSYTNNVIQCHECWAMADMEMQTHNLQEFFESVDKRCGELGISSSLPRLVVYVQTALKQLTTPVRS